jgi:hypothetical protein
MSKDNHQISFSALLENYEKKNYVKALDLFKHVKINSEESGISKQIKVETCIQLAFGCLKKYQFGEAIKYAEMNRELQPKPGFPFSFAKADIVLGLANLYLGQFEKAEKYLKDTLAKEETKPFFYYNLLNQLYAGKYSDLESHKAFEKENNEYFSQLSPDKKEYLFFIFYLIKEDYKNSLKFLKKIEPENPQEIENIHFLKEFLGNKKKKKFPDNLKPLYNVMAKHELVNVDHFYINHFPKLKEICEKPIKLVKEDDFDSELVDLCHSLKPLSKKATLFFLSNPNEQNNSKFIVYNQILALTQENEDNDSEIRSLLNKYKNLFFQVPESIYAYYNFTNEYNESIYTIVQNTLFYLEINKSKLSSFEIERISVNLILTIQSQDITFDSIPNALAPLQKIYGDLLGVCMINFLVCVRNQNSRADGYFQKMITHPLFYIYYDIILNQITNYISAISSDSFPDILDGMLQMLSGFGKQQGKMIKQMQKEKQAEFRRTIEKMLKNFEIKLEIDKKSKNILTIYGFLLKTIMDKNVDNLNIKPFIEAYLYYLEYFKQTKPGADYYNDFVSLNVMAIKSDLEKIIRREDYKTFEAKYITFISEKKEAIFQEVIIKILASENNVNAAGMIIYLLYKGYYDVYKDAAADYIIDLTRKIKEQGNFDIIVINEFLNQMLKKGKWLMSVQFILNIFKAFELLIFDPFHRNNVTIHISLMEFLFEVKKKDPKIKIEESIIKSVANFIHHQLFCYKNYRELNTYVKVLAVFGKPETSYLIDLYKELAEPFIKKDVKKIEKEYHKYLNKGKVSEFHNFMMEVVKKEPYFITDEFMYNMAKPFLEKKDEKSLHEAVNITVSLLTIAEESDVSADLSYIKFLQISYRQYSNYIYTLLERYISNCLTRKQKPTSLLEICDFLTLTMQHTIMNTDFCFNSILIKDCMKKLKPASAKTNSNKKIVETYKSAKVFFEDPTNAKKGNKIHTVLF